MSKYELAMIIIGAVGAIATFSAVVVALWQTKFTNKKKLIVTYTRYFRSLFEGEEFSGLSEKQREALELPLITVEAINIGNREVTLVDWGVFFTKKYLLQIRGLRYNEFPIKLAIEESSKLQIDWHEVAHAIPENFKDKTNQNKKMRFYITDSTGKKHYTKKYSIKKFISFKYNR